jgi:hypothetical protein
LLPQQEPVGVTYGWGLHHPVNATELRHQPHEARRARPLSVGQVSTPDQRRISLEVPTMRWPVVTVRAPPIRPDVLGTSRRLADMGSGYLLQGGTTLLVRA